MFAIKQPGWHIAALILSTILGIESAQAASAQPTYISQEQKTLEQAILVRNVLNNVTRSPVNLSVMTPVPAGAFKAQRIESPLVGKVVWVKGSFIATLKMNDGKEATRTLEKSSAIYLHDTLVTSKDAQAQIVFTDNTLMTFKPETKFYIKNYEYEKKDDGKTVGRYVMDLVEGGFRTITGLIAKTNPNNYQVNTPVATIGVRGTDYTVVLQDKSIYLARTQGAPCITNVKKEVCLNVKNKYATVLNANAVPTMIAQPPAFLIQPVYVQPVTVTQNTFADDNIVNATTGGTANGTGDSGSVPPASSSDTPASGSGGSSASSSSDASSASGSSSSSSSTTTESTPVSSSSSSTTTSTSTEITVGTPSTTTTTSTPTNDAGGGSFCIR